MIFRQRNPIRLLGGGQQTEDLYNSEHLLQVRRFPLHGRIPLGDTNLTDVYMSIVFCALS